MDLDIATILTIDGIASGAIYVLIGIGFVLIFTVTRVIFVPFGDIAAFTALTLASLETRHVPGTVGLVGGLAVIATAMDLVAKLKAGRYKITVADKSRAKGFAVQAKGHSAITISGIAFVGTHSVTVNFTAGQWTFYASPGGAKHSFAVS